MSRKLRSYCGLASGSPIISGSPLNFFYVPADDYSNIGSLFPNILFQNCHLQTRGLFLLWALYSILPCLPCNIENMPIRWCSPPHVPSKCVFLSKWTRITAKPAIETTRGLKWRHNSPNIYFQARQLLERKDPSEHITYESEWFYVEFQFWNIFPYTSSPLYLFLD